jgi:ribonucleotide monophosphatase NagD (HAD superfamily)
MTSPDLVWQGSFKEPRFGPKATLIAFKEVFKATYGYEMDVIEYGKPFKKTYDYAKKVAMEFAAINSIEV